MSRITIREADLTTVSSSLRESEVVYVPGFATTDPGYINISTMVEKGIPTLCSTIAEFESYFGSIPAVFSAAQAYPEAFDAKAVPNGNMFEALTVDPSYVYARELINAGIPVLYERINESDVTSALYGNDITVATMYDALNGTTIGFNNLTDTGEYSVKYMTSGGYPTFEYGATVTTKTVENPVIQNDNPGITAAAWVSGGQDIFLAHFNPTTTQTFRIVYDDANSVWKVGDDTVDLATDCGIQVAGTPASGDAIGVVVTVTTITTGSIVAKMLSVAATRGDCVAIIDHTNSRDRALSPTDPNSVYYSVSNAESNYCIASPMAGEYAAMFTPWWTPSYANLSSAIKNATFGSIVYDNVSWAPVAMPASFAYLMSLAYSVRNNSSWLAVAGVSRGIVPNFNSLYINNRLTNAIAEAYQPDDGIAINPITNIKPYGFTIWGNRTLRNNATTGGLTALSFLNIRNMVNDIKKRAYSAAKICLFEQNTDIMWLNFKSIIIPLLDQMTNGYGLSGYKIMRNESDSAVKVVATIRLFPIYAVESFDITVELSNSDISVE